MNKNRKLMCGISLIMFKIFFEFTMSNFVLEQYRYYGYEVSFSWYRCIIGWGIFFLYIPICLKYLACNDLRSCIMFFLSIMYFVPGLSIYCLMNVDNNFYILWLIFWGILLIFSLLPKKLSRNEVPKVQDGNIMTYVLLLFILSIVLFISWKYTGFKMTITFTNEYDLRMLERSIMLPRIIKYFYAATTLVFSMAICVCIVEKKYLLSALIIVIQVLNFSIGGHKSILLQTVIAIGFGALNNFFDMRKKIRSDYVLYAMSLEIILEYWVAKFLDKMFLVNNISRRVYFIPQLLNYLYYDFFQTNPYDYYAQGPGRFLGMETSYDKSIAVLIAEEYFGTSGNCNNGLFSEAYSNFGVWGCVLVPILLMFVIYILEQIVKESSWGLMMFYAFSCAYIWGSGNIATGLLTNGIILCSLMLYLRKNRNIK